MLKVVIKLQDKRRKEERKKKISTRANLKQLRNVNKNIYQ